jgi:hypothetical protein
MIEMRETDGTELQQSGDGLRHRTARPHRLPAGTRGAGRHIPIPVLLPCARADSTGGGGRNKQLFLGYPNSTTTHARKLPLNKHGVCS